jgi:hypothetical protein
MLMLKEEVRFLVMALDRYQCSMDNRFAETRQNL